MKFATRRNGSRDGQLLVVARDGKPLLWRPRSRQPCKPYSMIGMRIGSAEALYTKINRERQRALFRWKVRPWKAPYHAHSWVDGSAYINHIVLVRKHEEPSRQPQNRSHWSTRAGLYVWDP